MGTLKEGTGLPTGRVLKMSFQTDFPNFIIYFDKIFILFPKWYRRK
jgi:hypothetical protein